MKKNLLFVGTGAIAFCAVMWAFGWFAGGGDVRTISVTGECLTTAPRDRTAITLRVTTLDSGAAASMRQATAQVAEITNYLKPQDVQMQTTEFNSYEKTQWNHSTQKSEKLGIETTIAIEVSADNMEKIENVLTQFAGRPNVYSENLRMYTSAEALKPIMEKCLGVATQNARQRANALAAGDGRRAGRMLAVSYGTAPVMQPRATNFLRSAKMTATEVAFDSAGGTLVSKDTEISVSINAVFEIR